MNTIRTLQASRHGASTLGRHRSLTLARAVLLAAPIALVSASGADAASVSPTNTGVLHVSPPDTKMAGPGVTGTGHSDEFTPNPQESTMPKSKRKTPPKTTRALAAKTKGVRESPADPHRLATVFLRLRGLAGCPS